MHSFNVKYSGEGLTLINTAFFDCGGRQQLSVQTNYQRRKKRIAGRRILDKFSKEFFSLCHKYRIALLQSIRSRKTPHRYKQHRMEI